VRTIGTLVVALTLLAPAAGLAAEARTGKDTKIEAPVLPDLKLDLDTKNDKPAGTTGTTGAATPAASDPKKPSQPGKKDLDVSKMPFDAEAIRTVVKFHMPDIQACYEKSVSETGKNVEGRVVVGFIIDTNGNVSDARVLPKKSTLKDDRILDCVLQMRSWYFPKPTDNRDHPIEYPFDLKIQK
jgi:outer membrane biosynthesis protein TonB